MLNCMEKFWSTYLSRAYMWPIKEHSNTQTSVKTLSALSMFSIFHVYSYIFNIIGNLIKISSTFKPILPGILYRLPDISDFVKHINRKMSSQELEF